MAHFYAHENRYGVGSVYQRHDGSIDRLPGAILRFPTKAARDAWVADEVWDGNYKREAVTAAQVRSRIARAERDYGRAVWDDHDYHTDRDLPYEVLRA